MPTAACTGKPQCGSSNPTAGAAENVRLDEGDRKGEFEGSRKIIKCAAIFVVFRECHAADSICQPKYGFSMNPQTKMHTPPPSKSSFAGRLAPTMMEENCGWNRSFLLSVSDRSQKKERCRNEGQCPRGVHCTAPFRRVPSQVPIIAEGPQDPSLDQTSERRLSALKNFLVPQERRRGRPPSARESLTKSPARSHKSCPCRHPVRAYVCCIHRAAAVLAAAHHTMRGVAMRLRAWFIVFMTCGKSCVFPAWTRAIGTAQTCVAGRNQHPRPSFTMEGIYFQHPLERGQCRLTVNAGWSSTATLGSSRRVHAQQRAATFD